MDSYTNCGYLINVFKIVMRIFLNLPLKLLVDVKMTTRHNKNVGNELTIIVHCTLYIVHYQLSIIHYPL